MDEFITELCNDADLLKIKDNVNKFSVKDINKMIEIFEVQLQIRNILEIKYDKNNYLYNYQINLKKNINKCKQYLEEVKFENV